VEEAAEWYARSLAISEELGDRPKMAFSYGQLGLLAEARGSPGQVLEWTVRCVACTASRMRGRRSAAARPAAPAPPSARIGLKGKKRKLTARQQGELVRMRIFRQLTHVRSSAAQRHQP
jgi:hypothetical protein